MYQRRRRRHKVAETPKETEDFAEYLRTVQYGTEVGPQKAEEAKDRLSIGEMVEKLNEAHPDLHPARPCTIFRVPANIRQTDRNAYVPTVVKIGPLVHSEDHTMEGHKWRCVRYLLSRHRNGDRAGRLLDQCFMQMKALDADVRNCYADRIDPDAHELAKMMLLDGCFILYLLLKQADDQEGLEVKIEGNCSSTRSAGKLNDELAAPVGIEQESQNQEGMVVLQMDKQADNQEGLVDTKEEEVDDEEEGEEEEEEDDDDDYDEGEEEEEEGEEEGEEEEGEAGTSSSMIAKVELQQIIDELEVVQMGNDIEKTEMEVLQTGNDIEKNEMVVLQMGNDIEKIDKGPLLGMLWSWNFIIYDLLKLENQIPFFIINHLFQLLRTPNDQHLDLAELALRLFKDIHPSKSSGFKTLPVVRIHHLLHLFHSSIVPPQDHQKPIINEAVPEWIPNATELQRAGIKFKKKKKATSFLDVSFRDGAIEIPELRVYEYINSLFRNLIAFEQCYADTRTHVTIYSAFMDCIVDNAEDVKFLGLNGVVVNRLSTDEGVANLFNQLCNQVHYASDRNYLQDVFVNVKKYHESKLHQWRAALMRDYFSNPWTGISLVAAVVLLLLTVHQSVFAVLSYRQGA